MQYTRLLIVYMQQWVSFHFGPLHYWYLSACRFYKVLNSQNCVLGSRAIIVDCSPLAIRLHSCDNQLVRRLDKKIAPRASGRLCLYGCSVLHWKRIFPLWFRGLPSMVLDSYVFLLLKAKAPPHATIKHSKATVNPGQEVGPDCGQLIYELGRQLIS